MRNHGYRRAEQVWEHRCSVLFNGIDFGPNLMYKSFQFLPGKLKRQQTDIPGMPGKRDDSRRPRGYCVPENMTGTLELWVRDPAAWGMPVMTEAGYMSPEARFLAQISDWCKLEFISSNGFWMNASCTITKYGRFDLGFLIVLKIDAEPYWWEENRRFVEFDLGATAAVNLFDPETATLDTAWLPAGQSCRWATLWGRDMYVLNADPGCYANVTIGGLDATHRYVVSCNNVLHKGEWILFDQDWRRIDSTASGVTAITIRLISQASAYFDVGFEGIAVYDLGQNVETGEIVTLDAPLDTIYCTANAPCDLILDGERLPLPVGEEVPVYGLNIPPRTSVPVAIVSEVACEGYLAYQRGARSCTL